MKKVSYLLFPLIVGIIVYSRLTYSPPIPYIPPAHLIVSPRITLLEPLKFNSTTDFSYLDLNVDTSSSPPYSQPILLEKVLIALRAAPGQEPPSLLGQPSCQLQWFSFTPATVGHEIYPSQTYQPLFGIKTGASVTISTQAFEKCNLQSLPLTFSPTYG